MYTKLCLALLTLLPFEAVMAATTIEKTLKEAGDKIIKIVSLASLLFAVRVAVLYKRGNPNAKEQLESLIIGVIIVASASAWTTFIK